MPIELLKRLRRNRKSDGSKIQSSDLDAIKITPLNSELHSEFAKNCFKQDHHSLAYAEMLTAQFLGASGKESLEFIEEIKPKLPELECISHNEYFRYVTLSDEIKKLSKNMPASVLDVGGAHGQLAQFLPGYAYALADPQTNGISGVDLPFEDKSFDYVVSCHVLEHVPIEDRDRFLTQLLSKSKKALILLNPFHIPETSEQERLQLVIDITNADWAKEHLECSLPKTEIIEQFAKERDLVLDVKPNGTMTTSLALVLMEYFGSASTTSDQIKNISRFLNSLPPEIYHSETQPNAYLAVMRLKD